MELLLLISFITSFFATLFVTPHWIKRASKAGLTGIDLHKISKPSVAELGGIPVIFGFLIGILTFVAIRIFIIDTSLYILEIMAMLATILIITIIGIIDDILGWKIGLRQWQKPLLTLIAALPMMAINIGHSTMRFPILGAVDFGIFFPLALTPIAIVGASNGFNMVAGYNGLEAGMGMIILSTMSYVAWSRGNSWIAIIALCMVFSLLAFYLYNKYPSKIFPGDTMTYSVGALIAALALLGNMEKVAIILFVPYFIELFLKARGLFKKESFAKIKENDVLETKYDKIYGIEHAAIKFLSLINLRPTEKNVVYSLYSFQIIFVILSFIL